MNESPQTLNLTNAVQLIGCTATLNKYKGLWKIIDTEQVEECISPLAIPNVHIILEPVASTKIYRNYKPYAKPRKPSRLAIKIKSTIPSQFEDSLIITYEFGRTITVIPKSTEFSLTE